LADKRNTDKFSTWLGQWLRASV